MQSPHSTILSFILSLLCLFVAFAPSRAQTIDISSAAGIQWLFEAENSPDWKPIRVPAGGWRNQGYTCDAGSYRSTISIPSSAAGKTVRLAFAAVNFGADVSAGPDVAHMTHVESHINGWMPFTADITRLASPGKPLVVEVDVKGRRKYMRNGKYTVPEGATWDDKLEEGILRGVSLQILPKTRIEDMFVKTDVGPAGSAYDKVQAAITVVNETDRTASLELRLELSSWNHTALKYPHINPVTVRLAPGERRTINSGEVMWTAGPASYWWPNVPYRAGYRAQLHLLNAELLSNGHTVHSYVQRFGFRKFAISKSFKAVDPGPLGYQKVLNGAHYELNGVRCNLRGDNQQEADFGTDAYGVKAGFGAPSSVNPGWPQAVDNLLRLNFNVMRIHQIPATPYMLDTCDERGLMLVEESPLRGSEGGEDFENGREAMVNMDRELVLRDRNHPATVIWSAANEWTTPIPIVVPAMLALDNTRPVIADGVGDFDSRFVNMEHYVNGLGALPTRGGSPRSDRPYGETESIWPMDNTWQGFAWMAASVRLRRLLGDSDLRNYVLNNAWSNYIPGEGPQTEIIEKGVKRMGGDIEIRPALTDPWHNPHIRLMQQCYHPLSVCDIEFDRANAGSNANGDWPVRKPAIPAGSVVERQIAVFNDEFSGDTVELRYEALMQSGALVTRGKKTLTIPPGQFRVVILAFTCPKMIGDLKLSLAAWKGGVERFREGAIVFSVSDKAVNGLIDGVYRLVNMNSGLPAEVHGADAIPGSAVTQGAVDSKHEGEWSLKALGNGEYLVTNVATGMALAGENAASLDGSPAVQQKATGEAMQVWKFELQQDGIAYTLTNKGNGKVLDVFARSAEPGARIVLWQPNGGGNQAWELVPVKAR